ncbi:MAG: hypothetical protein ACQEQG_06220 [Bacillota bacterium]
MRKPSAFCLVFILLVVVFVAAVPVRAEVELLLLNQSDDPGYGLNMMMPETSGWSASINYYLQDSTYENLNILFNYHFEQMFFEDNMVYAMAGYSQLDYRDPVEEHRGIMLGVNFERYARPDLLAQTDFRVGVYPDKYALFFKTGFTYLLQENYGLSLYYQGINSEFGPVFGARIQF